jgi:hypothetical protein
MRRRGAASNEREAEVSEKQKRRGLVKIKVGQKMKTERSERDKGGHGVSRVVPKLKKIPTIIGYM